jgi:hypothetical protein
MIKFRINLSSAIKHIIGLTGPSEVKCNKVLFIILLAFIGNYISSCDFKKSDDSNRSYVKPSVDYKGKTRKGHVRKKVSTDKNAIKNRNRSKYYYETRGKYRRKKG